MSIKEDVVDVKKNVDEIQKESFGLLDLYKEIVADQRKANKRMFIMAITGWIAVVVLFVAVLIYESQFETVSECEKTQEVEYTENSTINQDID